MFHIQACLYIFLWLTAELVKIAKCSQQNKDIFLSFQEKIITFHSARKLWYSIFY